MCSPPWGCLLSPHPGGNPPTVDRAGGQKPGDEDEKKAKVENPIAVQDAEKNTLTGITK